MVFKLEVNIKYLLAITYNQLSNMPTIALDDELYLEGISLELQPGTQKSKW